MIKFSWEIRNTKFFQQKAEVNKWRMRIHSLILNDSSVIENEHDIANAFFKVWGSVMSSNEFDCLPAVSNIFSPVITWQENTFSIMINGSLHGSFKPYRGLRQGDPLSPLLFILGAEGISRLLRKARSISHLMFADDAIFFCKATLKELPSIKSILDKFEQMSGLMINRSKSSILFPNELSALRKKLSLSNFRSLFTTGRI